MIGRERDLAQRLARANSVARQDRTAFRPYDAERRVAVDDGEHIRSRSIRSDVQQKLACRAPRIIKRFAGEIGSHQVGLGHVSQTGARRGEQQAILIEPDAQVPAAAHDEPPVPELAADGDERAACAGKFHG